MQPLACSSFTSIRGKLPTLIDTSLRIQPTYDCTAISSLTPNTHDTTVPHTILPYGMASWMADRSTGESDTMSWMTRTDQKKLNKLCEAISSRVHGIHTVKMYLKNTNPTLEGVLYCRLVREEVRISEEVIKLRQLLREFLLQCITEAFDDSTVDPIVLYH